MKNFFLFSVFSKITKKGEQNAILVSQAIPFIEYDIHRQLMFKLKVLGRNSIFGLRFSISVTDTSIVGIASGTAVKKKNY